MPTTPSAPAPATSGPTIPAEQNPGHPQLHDSRGGSCHYVTANRASSWPWRFISPAPSGQEKNPYLYAEDDPVNRIDPSCLPSLGDVVGAVAGGFEAAAKTGKAAFAAKAAKK
ncbi:hypothetical protein GCM10018987_62290 [Streptomyces cremeus]